MCAQLLHFIKSTVTGVLLVFLVSCNRTDYPEKYGEYLFMDEEVRVIQQHDLGKAFYSSPVETVEGNVVVGSYD